MEEILLLLLKYKYLILFPIATFQGPIAALISGFLIFRGDFNFFIAYPILILGDVIPDTIYYLFGKYSRRNDLMCGVSKKCSLILGNMDIVRKLWMNHSKKLMALIKLAYGLSIPFLISAGFTKIPYRKFIKSVLYVSIIESGIIMGLGFLLGQSYRLGEEYLKYIFIIFTVMLVSFIAFHTGFAKYARRKIFRMEEEEATHQH